MALRDRIRTQAPAVRGDGTIPAPAPLLDWLLGIQTEEDRRNRRYLIYLLLVALFRWALASYDFWLPNIRPGQKLEEIAR